MKGFKRALWVGVFPFHTNNLQAPEVYAKCDTASLFRTFPNKNKGLELFAVLQAWVFLNG